MQTTAEDSSTIFSQVALFGSTQETTNKDELTRYLAAPRVDPEVIAKDISGKGILGWWQASLF